MKILYAIQGTGNGHLTRAKEIIPILKEKGEVDILISGNECEIQLDYPISFNLCGLNFAFGKNGGIDFWKTIRKFNLIRFFREIRQLPIKNYDLIINDFEPVSAWAAKLKNVNCISLSHQNAVLDEKSPKKGKFRLEKLILRYYAPATRKFGFHFQSYSSAVFTPIIRKQIRYSTITNKGHYTVYLPSYDHTKIIEVLSEIPLIKWHIFSKNASQLIFKKNMVIYPINEFDFIKSITSCEGVLCGAGFETPSEALFLEKKLMVIPMKNQFEQQCNAAALEKMGVPVIKSLERKRLKKIAKWIHSEPLYKVNYPDITEDILESFLLPYFNENLLTTTL
ncbi:MAG: glycosyl transferase [Polaribacter sp.]|nr:glycosyl transferase [Polaribacter sp.]